MTWVTTSGRTGCRGVARCFAPESIYAIVPFPLRSTRSGPWRWPLWLGARFRRQARAPTALPLRASGLDRSARPSKWLSCQDTEKRSLGPGIGLTEPQGELGFIQLRSSFSYELPQLPQDVKSLFVWYASNKQLLCLMHKYEQHTASLLWHDGPRFAAPLHATPLGGDYSSFQSGVPQTWGITLGPKGLSSGCKVFCSRST